MLVFFSCASQYKINDNFAKHYYPTIIYFVDSEPEDNIEIDCLVWIIDDKYTSQIGDMAFCYTIILRNHELDIGTYIGMYFRNSDGQIFRYWWTDRKPMEQLNFCIGNKIIW